MVSSTSLQAELTLVLVRAGQTNKLLHSAFPPTTWPSPFRFRYFMALDGSRIILRHRYQDSPQTAAHYRYSTLSTSKLRIPLHGQVGAGDIGIYYLEEFVSAVNGEGSSVECWVDDNYGVPRSSRMLQMWGIQPCVRRTLVS